PPPSPPPFPYTTLFRSRVTIAPQLVRLTFHAAIREVLDDYRMNRKRSLVDVQRHLRLHLAPFFGRRRMAAITTADVRRYVARRQDRKSTRLNSSHDQIS